MQALDQGECHQRVRHGSGRAFVDLTVQVRHFGIKTVGKNMDLVNSKEGLSSHRTQKH